MRCRHAADLTSLKRAIPLFLMRAWWLVPSRLSVSHGSPAATSINCSSSRTPPSALCPLQVIVPLLPPADASLWQHSRRVLVVRRFRSCRTSAPSPVLRATSTPVDLRPAHAHCRTAPSPVAPTHIPYPAVVRAPFASLSATMVFLGIYRAIYDYAPQSENELALTEGDLLMVLEKSTEDDWWKAKRKISDEEEEEPEGLIPNNYVEEVRCRLPAPHGCSKR
jgi:hypothetical protein